MNGPKAFVLRQYGNGNTNHFLGDTALQSTNDLRILSNIYTDLKMVQNRSLENFLEVIDTVDKLAIGASINHVNMILRIVDIWLTLPSPYGCPYSQFINSINNFQEIL